MTQALAEQMIERMESQMAERANWDKERIFKDLAAGVACTVEQVLSMVANVMTLEERERKQQRPVTGK